jgi:hypothetical protein
VVNPASLAHGTVPPIASRSRITPPRLDSATIGVT